MVYLEFETANFKSAGRLGSSEFKLIGHRHSGVKHGRLPKNRQLDQRSLRLLPLR